VCVMRQNNAFVTENHDHESRFGSSFPLIPKHFLLGPIAMKVRPKSEIHGNDSIIVTVLGSQKICTVLTAHT
jgi:hypothetical protein